MEGYPAIAHFVNSDRYTKALQEINDAIDNSVQSIPFVEPQLCAFIEDSVAMELLEKETENNQVQFEELIQIYRDIIEDVLLGLLELEPLEARKTEMLKTFSNSTLAKLLERYEISQREEAAVVAKLREQIKGEIDETIPLQTAVYEIETANRKLKKELKTLDLQMKRTTNELEQEKNIEVEDFAEDDERIVQARNMEQQLNEVNEQIEKGEKLKEQLEEECQSIQEEIDYIMEQLVAMNKRSVRNARKQGAGRK